MRDFMRLLVGAAEKGANIARIIRKDEGLFALLVEEKTGIQKNQRFVQDFKTLADVVIQEMLRWEISKKYPQMSENIFGEETNTFTNGEGETVTIAIQESVEETARLLGRVMGGENTGATLLSEEIHREIDDKFDHELTNIPAQGLIDNWKGVGVWIDPIDGTNEYIKGGENGDGDSCKIYEEGLHCVTVLIGAFNLDTGEPFAGVINQPFWKFGGNTWEGRHWWGVGARFQRICSPLVFTTKEKIINENKPDEGQNELGENKLTIILSSSEDPALLKKLEKKFNLVHAAGAGYKLLCVVMGMADLYVLSKDSTHYWDTCGPHAILRAQGGDILTFGGIDRKTLTYEINEEGLKHKFKNRDGIAVFRRRDALEMLNECL